MDQPSTVIDAVPAIRLETGEILSTREHYERHYEQHEEQHAAGTPAAEPVTAETPVDQEEHDATA